MKPFGRFFTGPDLSKFELPDLDPSKFGLGGRPPGDAGRRGAGLAAAMAEAGRRQAAAYRDWAARAAASRADGGADAGGPTLDMEAPSTPGGAWTAPAKPGSRRPDSGGSNSGGSNSGGPDLAELLRGLRDALPGGVATQGPRRGAAPAVPPGARFEARRHAGPAGARDYKVYVPSGRDGRLAGRALPVVVMLHGCTQDPDDFAAGTRMNAVAEEEGFLVAYPAQSRAANAQGCWNWYAPADQRRAGGEPELIAGIARAVLAEFGGDPGRVYAAGLSAGGAQAAILAATHPDLFAAVGVHSGLACGAARDLPGALAAMRGGGVAVARNGRPVPTIVFHGDGDRTVHPVNGERVAAQAAPAGALAETVEAGRSPGGVAYTRTRAVDADGRAVLERWALHGVGHAWSGGSPDGSFTDPRGPDASREMARFFRAHADPR